ncbi:leishmanolysin family protein, putative [Ichthyophthirius multifiliis]|uniref:Leishmanolysin family protein, putative n=1 Tax=Ichthyophthirius multifiliis TaxID=5932 RepID=G0QQ09_ICHMU|nr:leishmanolysin family protein, putative [Ichthyophthirius multifiliis]EGR32691.1 leishmanolysin family protein, putative [Ichthyophthirius multifiliis]|eukprot:XP_004036677.1 leishmanolysin family protein, putative [Ichthyophthirius multifiliis]
MKQFLIILYLISCIISFRLLKHKCVHDQMKQKYKYKSIPPDMESLDIRNLQNKTPRNMVITYDMSYFSRLPSHDSNKQLIGLCENALQLAIDYFSRLIKIIPKSEVNMRYKSSKCGNVVVPQIDKTNGKNSDLHLYIQYEMDLDSQYYASATWCQFLDGQGPSHGLINFNFAEIVNIELTDYIEYKNLIEIIIHEITHILGFSDDDMPKWINSKGTPYSKPTITQKIRGIDTLLLITPHVLEFARKYFNCPTLPGMPLQNLGNQSSKNSHWENTIIQNEYMNASVSMTQAYFSGFTTNLLRDTGFYAQIDESMEEQMFYGKGKGCEHVLSQCRTSTREFCDPKTDEKLCDFYHNGLATCTTSQFNDPGCNNLYTKPEYKCWDVNSDLNQNQFIERNGIYIGTDSRCFNSNLLSKKIQKKNERMVGYCFKYECNANGQQVTIHIQKEKIVCRNNKEKMTVQNYQGYIECPENIQEFCGFKKICPNFCSGKGFCQKNKCYCIKGFSGEDCSKKQKL